MERTNKRVATYPARKARGGDAQRTDQQLSTNQNPRQADREKAAELAFRHRRLLTGVIDSPGSLLCFVIWVGCSALAGQFSREEARMIAALLLPFAKIPGAFPLSTQALLAAVEHAAD